ncbi:AMP-binding protein [Rhodococcus kronopolitis]|uniref:AMP-binding protein n=1 Tax=Rhodococcus kronopolitis TaxID=1460226 RepID=A0ABV9FPA0_9NOCA
MEIAELTAGSVWTVLVDSARRHADREAVVDDRERLTYEGLTAAAFQAGAAMAAAGVRPGDRVALWGPNSARWGVIALGAHSVGAAVVPVNTRARGAEAAQLLRRTQARLLFVADDFLGTGYSAMLREAAGGPGPDGPVAGLPALRGIVDFYGPSDGPLTGWPEFVAAATAPRRVHLRPGVNAAPGPDAVAYVMSTSGSTGEPKGVVVRHGQLVRTYTALGRRLGIGSGDRILGVTPLSHSMGLNAGLLAALLSGGCYVAVDVFDPATALSRIGRESITVLSGPPTLFTDLMGALAAGAGAGYRPPRLAVTGATTVTAALLERIRNELGIAQLVTGYGLTEATGTVTARHPSGDAGAAALGAPPLPGVELRVVDAEGRPVESGTAGEVLVRGFNVTTGYHDDPGATARAIDPDGWLHTGDVGVLNEAGELRIVDRLGDTFIVGGFNVYPSEVEQVLGRAPGVAEVAVVGVPDERLGERGIAYVVATPGTSVTARELLDRCRRELAGYKVPTEVITLGELPRLASGKPSRRALRELADRTRRGATGSGGSAAGTPAVRRA